MISLDYQLLKLLYSDDLEYIPPKKVTEKEKEMRDIVEQVYDELNAHVVRMNEYIGKQAKKISELEQENLNLRYELNAALQGGSVAIPSAEQKKVAQLEEVLSQVGVRVWYIDGCAKWVKIT